MVGPGSGRRPGGGGGRRPGGGGRKRGGGVRRRTSKVASLMKTKRVSVWDSMSSKQRNRAMGRDRADAKAAAKRNWR